jgi:CHAT domain-containing protein
VRAVEGGRALSLGQAVRAARVREELLDRLSTDDREALDDALRRFHDAVSKDREYGTFSDEVTRAALREGLDQRAHRALHNIRQIAGRYGLKEDAIDAATLRRALPADEGFAYVLATRWGSLALFVEVAGVTPVWCDDLTSGTLVELLTQRDEDGVAYLAALFDGGEALAAHLERVLHGVGPLVAPLSAQVRTAGITRLTLVPAGLLGLVPLHAAAYPGPAGEVDLLAEVAVAYAPSGLTWRAARERAARPVSELRLAAVANPLPTDEPLTFALAEAEEIRHLFPFGRVLAEDAATKEAVLAAAAEATHVHFGCHANYDVEFPLASQIELARREILTLQELIDRTSLAGVRVVVVAACQSGMAGLDKTPDEALGFPAGFLRAGASAVVAALWPVHDLTAALIAVRTFADIVAGAPPAEALAAAQRWLRRATAGQISAYMAERPALARAAHAWLAQNEATPDVVPFSSPTYWAPYVVVGG